MKRKIIRTLSTLAIASLALASCGEKTDQPISSTDDGQIDSSTPTTPETPETPDIPETIENPDYSAPGFAAGKISDRVVSEEDADVYIKVSTPMEFMDAIKATYA